MADLHEFEMGTDLIEDYKDSRRHLAEMQIEEINLQNTINNEFAEVRKEQGDNYTKYLEKCIINIKLSELRQRQAHNNKRVVVKVDNTLEYEKCVDDVIDIVCADDIWM
jgi:parvulin-like peptidyl-prolyl isomerase